jgi:hypothetical protein
VIVSQCCSLVFHQTAVTIADINPSLSLSSVAVALEEFTQYVNQHSLRGKKTLAMLSPADYQLLRVKKPESRSQEMLTAILWQEQSKFSLPIDQLVIDYVECPTTTDEKRIYVAAIGRRTLRQYYEMMLNVGLQPIKITLPELIYAQYAQKYYVNETTIIWINQFPDAIQVIAVYQGELVATLKLPKTEHAVISEASITSLNMFYLTEIKAFSTSPLWLLNGIFSVDPDVLEQLNGRKQWLRNETHEVFYKSLERFNHSSASHAYYGLMANE